MGTALWSYLHDSSLMTLFNDPESLPAYLLFTGWLGLVFLSVILFLLKMSNMTKNGTAIQQYGLTNIAQDHLLRLHTEDDPFTWVMNKEVLLSGDKVDGVVLNSILNKFTGSMSVEDSLQLKLDRLMGLRKIDIAILSTMDMEEILKTVLEQIDNQLNPSVTMLYLIEPNSGQLRLKLSSGTIEDIEGIKRNISGKAFEAEATEVSRIPMGEGKQLFQVATPLIGRTRSLGALELYYMHDHEISADWLLYYEAVARQLAIAIEHVQLIEQYETVNNELQNAQEVILQGWAKALEFKDRETQGHSDRVTVLTRKMGEALGLEKNEITNMIRGALLHDIGKMAIPDDILIKKGPLSEEEWEIMKKHPLYAQDFLQGIGFLDDAMPIPLYHHERLDGSGYPFALAGDAIPLPAKIFAIIDMWDALTHNRPYRGAWEPSKAKSYLQELAGEKLDPDLVEVFFGIIE